MKKFFLYACLLSSSVTQLLGMSTKITVKTSDDIILSFDKQKANQIGVIKDFLKENPQSGTVNNPVFLPFVKSDQFSGLAAFLNEDKKNWKSKAVKMSLDEQQKMLWTVEQLCVSTKLRDVLVGSIALNSLKVDDLTKLKPILNNVTHDIQELLKKKLAGKISLPSNVEKQILQNVNILKKHKIGVCSVAWSKNGYLALGSSNNTVYVYKVDDKTNTMLFIDQLEKHTNTVCSVAWGKDGYLALGSADETVCVYKVDDKTNKILFVDQLKMHTDDVYSVAWSKDGYLASGSGDCTVCVYKVDDKTDKILFFDQLKNHDGEVYSVVWSKEGYLALGSHDKKVYVYKVDDKTNKMLLVGQFGDHKDRVSSVAWSNNGYLASGSGDCTVCVYKIDDKTNKMLLVDQLRSHEGSVCSVAWSNNGYLALGSWDKTVYVYKIDDKTNTMLRVGQLKEHTDIVRSVAWSKDGYLASGSWDNTVCVYNLSGMCILENFSLTQLLLFHALSKNQGTKTTVPSSLKNEVKVIKDAFEDKKLDIRNLLNNIVYQSGKEEQN